jgi:hypothetical protein
MRQSLLAAIVFLSSLAAATAQQQDQQPNLTARDVFWSANDLVVNPNPAATPPPSAPANKTTSKPRQTKSQIDPQSVPANGFGLAPHLIKFTNGSAPLGLRCILLQRAPDGTYQEAAPNAVFHSGDHVRLSVTTNTPGYLYVINHGSSGNWAPIFPASKQDKDANRIEPGNVYQIPKNSAFEFDQREGDEQLYIILSRSRMASLDNIIFGGHDQNTATPAPAAPATTGLQATNRITDELAQQFKGRDLVMAEEHVDYQTSTKDTTGEQAIYVVSKVSNNKPDATIMAHLTLAHH